MRRSAHRLALLGPISVAGALLYLLVPLATTAEVTGPVVPGRPIVWLSLQVLLWAAAVILVGRRRHAADQIRLSTEAEQLNRTIAACAASFEQDDQLTAIVTGLDDLLVVLRDRGP